MRLRLSRSEVETFQRMYDKAYRLMVSLSDDNRDVRLSLNDSTVSEQLSCVCTAFETILQEY